MSGASEILSTRAAREQLLGSLDALELAWSSELESLRSMLTGAERARDVALAQLAQANAEIVELRRARPLTTTTQPTPLRRVHE